MAKSSQLNQLKSKLSTAGLNRQSQPGGSRAKDPSSATNNKRKRGPDDEKKLAKIRKEMNPFEESVMRLKHDVGGRKLKGSTGRPGQAKQAGLEERKRTLLPALSNRHRTGTFVDRRFGESNPTLTPEEKMLERFTKEKQRASVRGGRQEIFNLGDDEDEEGGGLTHYGKSLGFDDFEGEGMGGGLGFEDEEEGGQIDRDTVKHDHFGGFDDEGDAEDKPERKKSKSEVMAEVMAKSKDHKYARQLEREKDDEARLAIDADFSSLRDILMGVPFEGEETADGDEDPALTASATNRIPLGPRAIPLPTANPVASESITTADAAAIEDPNAPVDYDTFVRSLAFDRRAKPTDRTKTEEEVALEEREKLEEEEKKRLRRMRGEVNEEDEEEDGKKGKKGGKKEKEKRKRGADDLEDDYEGMGEELQGEGEGFGLGEGLGAAGQQGVEMVTFMDPGSGSEEEEGSEEGSDEDDDEEESGEEDDEEEEEDDFDDLDGSEGEAAAASSDEDAQPTTSTKTIGSLPSSTELLIPAASKSLASASARASKLDASKSAAKRELPFTFPCPASHEEFLDLLEEHQVEREEDVELVVKRIRAVWHPKLGEGNRERMQIFLTILIDHIFSILSPPNPSFSLLSLLLPHITSLTTSYPLLSAQHSISKLVLMQKNLSRGLSRGAALPDSKTWPGAPELGLLRVVGVVWSTSDYSHPVAAPAMLLMGQYLSQARIRGTRDVASGLFLSSLVLQYESLSKRFMPEITNFLSLAILLLSPNSFTTPTSLPGSTPFTDFDAERCASLKIKTSKASSSKTLNPRTPDLPSLLEEEEEEEQSKVDLLATAWKLVVKFAELWNGLEGFAEVFGPIKELMEGLKVGKLSSEMQKLHTSTLLYLTNTLRFSLLARKPLHLQAHKPIPIPSYVPKFEGSSYSHTKRYDPDAERNAASKLKSQYKQERKGAIRELRKDARFLAGERNRVRDEKDVAYETKMRHVKGAITVERAEEKQMEREKARDKKRAGK
ncbi:nucleolar protein 14 [Mrakia frigida]|uniref:snoRNA-binding rRNA-processing protein NOP14 n=1 Tax=Mrakia frigida TaxID=29902 RepID=UPI003FCC134A